MNRTQAPDAAQANSICAGCASTTAQLVAAILPTPGRVCLSCFKRAQVDPEFAAQAERCAAIGSTVPHVEGLFARLGLNLPVDAIEAQEAIEAMAQMRP